MPRPLLRVRIGALLVMLAVLAACGAPAPGAAPSSEASTPAASAASAAASAASAAPSAAPSAASAAPATESAAAATPQETLIFAADLTDQITMDPAAAYEFGGLQVVGNIYETLVSFDPGDPAIKPVLAKSWDIQDNGDGWTLTFKLDERAKFASGRPVTANDVVYSWGRAIDLDKSPAFLLKDIAQLTKDSFRAVDPQTFEVKLPKTSSPQVFLSVISFTVAAVVDQQEVEANAGSDQGSRWLNDHSAGSGPYVLERWDRNAQNVLNLNPNFWRETPQIKRVIMRNITELTNLQSAIETGEADIVQDLGPEQVQALQNNPDIKISNAASTQLVYLAMNAKIAPFDNADVREAVRYAINYDEIVNNLLGGNAKVVQEIIPEGLFGYTGSRPFTPDIAKAKDLITKAGIAEGTAVELLAPTGPAPGGVEWGTLAAKLQSDLQQIGLTVNIKQTQEAEVLNVYRAQKAQIALVRWGPDFPDPDGNVTPFTNYEAKSIAWRNQWEAPDIAKLAQDATLEQDATKRAALYKQITERVQHEGPYAILYQPTRAYGVRSNIQGFVSDPADTPSISFWLITKQ